MAFNIKKKKRLPAQTEGSTSSGLIGNATEGQTSDLPIAYPDENTIRKSNVVATQSWVYRVLKRFWDWTKFFATESMQVAGGLNAGRVSTCELQTEDAYATRLTLLDPNGRPAQIYINELGELKIDYDFRNVFVYPGSGDLDIGKFVYRYGMEPEVIASNFVGLTPYELQLNFVKFESNCHKEFNGKSCNNLCTADGIEEQIDKTLLFTCPMTKKITKVYVVDVDGQPIGDPFIDLSEDERTFRKMTINMPSFLEEGAEVAQRVILPSEFPSLENGAFQPFVPPFLLPPKPPFFCPPVKPCVVPPGEMVESLGHDIFDENQPIASDDIFDDIDKDDESESDEAMHLTTDYEVVYEDYFTKTYFNLALKRSDFTKNQEQYLMVETVDA